MIDTTRSAQTAGAAAEHGRALDVAAVHAAHAGFVWLTLQRFGVREADLEDMLQEVFVVVHKRLHTFDGSSQLTTWLYGICMRVASDHRRRAYVRRERAVDVVPEPQLEGAGHGGVFAAGAGGGSVATGAQNPEDAAAAREARARLDAMLDELDLDKRAVFVMFEVDEMSCDEIAAVTGVPVGTVYSRLHAARKDFARVLARWRAREAHGGGAGPATRGGAR